MPSQQTKPIALISTPWPFFSRPSIQLGVLKSYLNREFPTVPVQAHHAYLEVAKAVGYAVYSRISENTWSSEAVYAALLYPEKLPEIEALFHRERSARVKRSRMPFQELAEQVKAASNDFICRIPWNEFLLVGFSICLCQLMSSIYFIQSIKKRHPNVPVIIGGSMVPGETAAGFLKAFPEIEAAVIGEGEKPLAGLVRLLIESEGRGIGRELPGVVRRQTAPPEAAAASVRFDQMESLDGLAPPDFEDYFRLLESFPEEKRFFPTLPVEMSRGCWWQGRGLKKEEKGCAFCSLNLQWEGYRFKKAQQVLSEIDLLTRKHRLLSLAFVDNLLPSKEVSEIADGLDTLGRDLDLFGEIRPDTPALVLRDLKRCGFGKVQIGIEALSTRLLRKMNKGASAIHHIQLMRDCEELGISHTSNLILEFPGSDEKDVEESLFALEFVQPFRPLHPVHFWLGLGSSISRTPKLYGIDTVYTHPNYRVLLPSAIVEKVVFPLQGFRGPIAVQRRLWKPVRRRLRQWQDSYDALRKDPDAGPILTFRDGGDFLILRHRQHRSETMTHRLAGSSRGIYLFCRSPQSLDEISTKFPALAREKIQRFLEMMVGKRVMFMENGRFLSLAIREKNKGAYNLTD